FSDPKLVQSFHRDTACGEPCQITSQGSRNFSNASNRRCDELPKSLRRRTFDLSSQMLLEPSATVCKASRTTKEVARPSDIFWGSSLYCAAREIPNPNPRLGIVT